MFCRIKIFEKTNTNIDQSLLKLEIIMKAHYELEYSNINYRKEFFLQKSEHSKSRLPFKIKNYY